MPVEEVGYTVGHDATPNPRCGVRGRRVHCNSSGRLLHHVKDTIPTISNQVGFIVRTHDTNIDGRIASPKRIDGQSSRLQSFIDGLHEEALLRVNGLSLDRLDAEELCVKSCDILIQEVGVADVAVTVVGRVWMIVGLSVEPRPGDLAAHITRLAHEIPELGRRGRSAGEAARAAYQGNGLVDGRGLCHRESKAGVKGGY